MQKVITINLNGRGFQLEEPAYDSLRAYLDAARLALKDNPDLAEITADLEQAIGEKCDKCLGPHKTVVTAAEIRQILDEMGPVNGTTANASQDQRQAAPSSSGPSASDGDAPKRLYQIHQGAILSGVCQGIAAYLNIDVTLVRIVFIALGFVSKGGFALVYLILMYVIPRASTSEEHAAAHGAPFNAKEIIDQAAAKARDVTDEALKGTASLKADWKRQRREWKQEWRRERREWRREWRQSRMASRWWWTPPPPAAAPSPIGYAAQVTAGVLVPLLSLALAVVFWIWAAATMSVLVTGAVFGRPLPDGLPMWAALVGLVLLLNFVSWPLHHARYVSRAALGGRSYYGGAGAWDGMMGLGFFLLCGWAAYHYIPEVREFITNLPFVRDRLIETFRFR